MCKICLEEGKYFKDGICRDCPEAGSSVTVLIVLLAVALIITSALYLLHEQRKPEYDVFAVPLRRVVHYAKDYTKSVGLTAKLKSALTFVCQNSKSLFAIHSQNVAAVFASLRDGSCAAGLCK